MTEIIGNSFGEQFKKFLIDRESDKIDEKLKDFSDIISAKYKKNNVYDEIVDFFDILNGTYTRWQSFGRYIELNFPRDKFKNILDVGCGPSADLSKVLISKGYEVTGIDPRAKEIEQLKVIRGLFDYKKTNILDFDLIVGLEPCDATEHIIRSSMEHSISFAISLCAVEHDGIDGHKFANKEEWYKYLLSLTDGKGIYEEKRILNKSHQIIKRII